MPKKLKMLFATDFSAGSRIATETLKILRKAYILDLSLIHVLKSRWIEPEPNGFYEIEALQRLEIWQKEFCLENNPENLYVEKGNAAEIIIQTANNISAGLILLGGKIYNYGRYKTGDTAETVVRHASQSVCVAKSSSLLKILCGIDGSALSARALNKAIELSRAFSAKLCVTCVISSPDFNSPEINNIKVESKENFAKEISKKIQIFLHDFDFSNVEVEYHYPWGIPAHVILDAAEDFSYDLIVIGAKGHSLLHNILIGSTTEKILRYAPCSLLVVR